MTDDTVPRPPDDGRDPRSDHIDEWVADTCRKMLRAGLVTLGVVVVALGAVVVIGVAQRGSVGFGDLPGLALIGLSIAGLAAAFVAGGALFEQDRFTWPPGVPAEERVAIARAVVKGGALPETDQVRENARHFADATLRMRPIKMLRSVLFVGAFVALQLPGLTLAEPSPVSAVALPIVLVLVVATAVLDARRATRLREFLARTA